MKKHMSTRQRIDASHEARLWITQVVLPVAGIILAVDFMHPELKYAIRDGAKETGQKIKKKFKKEP